MLRAGHHLYTVGAGVVKGGPSNRPESDETMACRHFGRSEAADEGVIVGELQDVNDFVCVDCRAEELETRTMLTDSEARLVALEQLGDFTTDEIASRLDIEAATVEEAQRRIRDRVENAPERAARMREEAELLERTASELRDL